jgi:hypothetical protein
MHSVCNASCRMMETRSRNKETAQKRVCMNVFIFQWLCCLDLIAIYFAACNS